MKKIILGIIFILPFVIQAQNDDGVRIILKSSVGKLQSSSFYIYEPPFIAKGIYRDTVEAVNKYPEQLILLEGKMPVPGAQP